ncbi:protein farnesyltransferase subunit beta-like isoform X2 [Rhopilema esculentum]
MAAFSGVLAGLADKLKFKDNGVQTETSVSQEDVEESLLKCYNAYAEVQDLQPNLLLFRERHVEYLRKGLHHLSSSYQCLDASRAWLCFWILHSLELLDVPIPCEDAERVARFLDKCQDKNGGFGGGPGQMPHLAPTYAAVCSLCILARFWEGAYDIIDRPALKQFLMYRRTPEGSFTMHRDGEVDIRGAYCAVVVARLTNIAEGLFEGTADWLASCQTYEGGFSGLPGLEAHGGYAFCGFAALALLGSENKANIKSLLRWVANRQMRLEGGFQGRTNKLVDGCYSFWQGGLFPILHNVLQMYDDEELSQEEWLFNQDALQQYVLLGCQNFNGGLLDKPGKSRDFYHTCYCLSGLSIAQNFIGDEVQNTKVVGSNKNLLKPTHPAYNICVESAYEALEYFRQRPLVTIVNEEKTKG